jgi:hypothetical protein
VGWQSADARKLYERLALLNDDQKVLEREPWPATGAIRFVLAWLRSKSAERANEEHALLSNGRSRWIPQNELAISQLAELKRGNEVRV